MGTMYWRNIEIPTAVSISRDHPSYSLRSNKQVLQEFRLIYPCQANDRSDSNARCNPEQKGRSKTSRGTLLRQHETIYSIMLDNGVHDRRRIIFMQYRPYDCPTDCCFHRLEFFAPHRL